MQFQCNICGNANDLPEAGFTRDEPSCAHCRSTVRLRSMFYTLAMDLFGTPMILPEFPVLKSIRGIGLSDHETIAPVLTEKFDYRNTFYDMEPRFDIANPDERDFGLYDFVLSGDVFEHVEQPLERALANVKKLLKPGGRLVMTVPYSLRDATIEHFPDLHDYAVAKLRDRLVLVNRTVSGEIQVYDNLVFHGGHGAVLELRVFCEADLRSLLNQAGFAEVDICSADFLPYGIRHLDTWSLPIVASNGPYALSRDAGAELARQYVLRRDMGGWAKTLAEEVEENRAEILRLQSVEAELRQALAERTVWAQNLESGQQTQTAWIEQLNREQAALTGAHAGLQQEFEERTEWALALQSESENLRSQLLALQSRNDALQQLLAGWRASRWSKLGRSLGLGPSA